MEDPEDDLADIFAKAMGIPDSKYLRWAKHRGVTEPLAAYIEQGGEVGLETRRWLAAYLRGSAPKGPRGNKRTPAQVKADATTLREILEIQSSSGASFEAAKRIYLDRHLDMNPETLKSCLKRARRGNDLPV